MRLKDDVSSSDAPTPILVLRRWNSESDLSLRITIPVHELLHNFPVIGDRQAKPAINASTILHPSTAQDQDRPSTLAWSAMDKGYQPSIHAYDNPDLRRDAPQSGIDTSKTVASDYHLANKPYAGKFCQQHLIIMTYLGLGMHYGQLYGIVLHPLPITSDAYTHPKYPTRPSVASVPSSYYNIPKTAVPAALPSDPSSFSQYERRVYSQSRSPQTSVSSDPSSPEYYGPQTQTGSSQNSFLTRKCKRFEYILDRIHI